MDSLKGHHSISLQKLKLQKKKLKENSLVLLDDKGDKTNLSIDYMLRNNFKIINETREQVLLSCK